MLFAATVLVVAVTAGLTVRSEMAGRATALSALDENTAEGGNLVLVANGRINIAACDQLSRTHLGGGFVSAAQRINMLSVPGFRLKLYSATPGFLSLAGANALAAHEVVLGPSLSERLGLRQGAVIASETGQARLVAGTLSAEWLQDRSDGVFGTIAPIGESNGECWIAARPEQQAALIASMPAQVSLEAPRESAQRLPTTHDRADILARYRAFDPERGPLIVFAVSFLAGLIVLATRARELAVYSSAGYSAREVLLVSATEVTLAALLTLAVSAISSVIWGAPYAHHVSMRALLEIATIISTTAALGTISTAGIGFVVARVLRGRVFRAEV